MRGRGPTVLHFHGGNLGHNGWFFLAHLVGSGYRLLTPHRPGYLGTPLGGNGSSEAQADVATALLDALKVERVAVVGISAGGHAAIQFAARHPERTRALVLLSAVSRRTPQLNSALGRLMMTRRFQNPAYFLIHGAPHAPNLAATHWVPASCHRRDLHAGLRAEISPYRRRSSVSLLRAASDPIVQEMPEGRAGRGRLAARLSQGKPPKTGSFRPPVTSILTRFRWPRSSTRLPALHVRAGAGRCRVEVEAMHADDDGRCRRIAGQRQRRQRRRPAAGRGCR